MKFCPKCGAQMDDDAKFCPKCGELQPGFEERKVVEEPVKKDLPKDMSDSEKFDHLMKTDERFKDTWETSRKTRFFNFINLLFIVPWLVCILGPIGMFTGANVSSKGQEILASHGIMTPFTYSGLTIEYYKNLGDGYKIAPSGLNGIMPIIVFAMGFVLIALTIVFSLRGNWSKGAFLKSWLAPNGDITTMRAIKSSKGWFIGPMMCIASMMSMVVTYANSTGLKYDYSDGKYYIFGEVMGLSPTLVAGIILSIIFTAVIIVGIAVPTSIFNKKITKHLEQAK